jgi:hypothetical protein
MRKNTLIERAARALDLTHRCGERGPRTWLARNRLATALDLNRPLRLAEIAWLEHVAAGERPCRQAHRRQEARPPAP